MSKTSNVFARVEPELKSQAEAVLSQIGLPMSNAITLFLKQVVLRHGVPFPLTLPQKPKGLEEMTQEELFASLKEAMDSEGRPVDETFAGLRKELGFGAV